VCASLLIMLLFSFSKGAEGSRSQEFVRDRSPTPFDERWRHSSLFLFLVSVLSFSFFLLRFIANSFSSRRNGFRSVKLWRFYAMLTLQSTSKDFVCSSRVFQAAVRVLSAIIVLVGFA
jgi:hypothetical protein